MTARTTNHRRLLGRATLVLLAVLTALAAAGCTPSADAEKTREAHAEGEAAPREITVTAKNYFFVAPDTIEAGYTTIRLSNKSDDFHHLQLARLAPGKTTSDLEMHLAANPHVTPEWVSWVGGPNAPLPGEAALGTLELEPGNYALLCVIPARDGQSHAAKGMVRGLTVVGARGRTAAEPVADLTIRLADYDFELSSELRAGRRTIRVENGADQPHEAVLFQLAPGKTMADLTDWLGAMEGPPPAKPLGGATVIEKGRVNFVTVDLEQGSYALVCFVPDVKDGKAHLAHGMIKQITVN